MSPVCSFFYQAFTHQIQFKLANCFREQNFPVGASEIQRIEGTLHDAGAALHALVRPWLGGQVPALIHLITIFGADLLTETGALAFFGINNNVKETIFVQTAFVNRGAARQIDADHKNNRQRSKSPVESEIPCKTVEQDAAGDESEHENSPEEKGDSPEVKNDGVLTETDALPAGIQPSFVQRKTGKNQKR